MSPDTIFAVWYLLTFIPPTESHCESRGCSLLFTFCLGQPDGSTLWLSLLTMPYDFASHGDSLFRDFASFGCVSRGHVCMHWPLVLPSSS